MKIEMGINLETKEWKNKSFFEKEIYKNNLIASLLNEVNLKNLIMFLTKFTLEELIPKENLSKTHFEISFLLSDNKRITELNKNFRSQNKPTNVLSFESCPKEELDLLLGKLGVDPESKISWERDIFLGEIIFAFEKIQKESEDLKIDFINHFSHLVIHGILHLLGFDHERSEEDAEIMEGLEIKILSKINIENPYI
jgi:probable rRNA maturation factor